MCLSLAGALAGTYTANFNSGSPLPGMTLYGTATLRSSGGVGNSGYLKLTDTVNGEEGSFVVDDFDQGNPLFGFTFRMKLHLGEGGAIPADGFSVNFARDLPNGSFGEEGAGTGLSVSFDTFNNGFGEAPAVDVRFRGVTVSSVFPTIDRLQNTDFQEVFIQLYPDGTLDVKFGAITFFSRLRIPGWAFLAGAKFGVGARTGGYWENAWVDDLSIVTTPDTSGTPSVLTGPILNPANGHSYYLLDASSWTASEQKARELGGHLVTINNQAEMDFVYSQFSRFGAVNRDLWLGLYDPEPHASDLDPVTRMPEFIWVSGEPVTYAKWNAGEPNNRSGELDNLGIEPFGMVWRLDGGTYDGMWNDLSNNHSLYRPNGVVEIVPGATAKIYGASWSDEIDQDSDGYKRSAKLTWDPDVVGAGSITVHEKLYWRLSSGGSWMLLSSTAPHVISGTVVSDRQSISIDGGDRNLYDWQIEIYRVGSSTADFTLRPTDDSDLARYQMETAAQDAPQYTITLSSAPSNGGAVGGAGTFPAGVSRTVTATPNAGYSFLNWSEGGNVVSTSASYSFTLNGQRNLTANFRQNPVTTATIYSAAWSNEVDLDQDNYKRSARLSWDPDAVGSDAISVYEIVYRKPVSASAWVVVLVTATHTISGASTSDAQAIDVNGGDRNLYDWQIEIYRAGQPVPDFTLRPANESDLAGYPMETADQDVLQYSLSLSASPAGAGFTTGAGSFVSGTGLTISATAAAGFTFVNWTENGVVVSTSASYGLTMNSNRSLVANFVPVLYTIALVSSPAGAGSVSGAGTFSAGSSQRVNATANTGYTFVNWTEGGNVVTGLPNYTFTVTGNRTLVANFAADPRYTITPLAGANGSISPSSPQTIAAGGSVAFTAIPASGYEVDRWTVNGALVQTGGTAYTVANASANVSVQVTFARIPSPGDRSLQIGSANAASPETTVIPITLSSKGDENAVSFSLSFPPNQAAFSSITLGSGASGASLVANTNQASSGKIGVVISMPVNQTFPAGTRQLLALALNVASGLSGGASVTVQFGSTPANQSVSDVLGNDLAVNYINGSINIIAGFEGDVAPRPPGSNNLVNAGDVAIINRLVAGLETGLSSSDFQRADCAPRSSFGNGALNAGDVAQVQRYAAGLDPMTPAGGPVGSVVQSTAGRLHAQAVRQISLPTLSAKAGASFNATIKMEAQGDENALSFSLVFDPLKLTFNGISLGKGGTGASLVVNTNQLPSGKLGVVLSLAVNQVFPAGSTELLNAAFIAGAAAGSTTVAFANLPAAQSVSDALGNDLTSQFIDGVVTIESQGGGTLPVMTAPPQSFVTAPGEAGSFAVSVTGATSYQWQLNGVNIPNATGSILDLQNLTMDWVGLYTVIAANASGSITSAPVSLNLFGDLKMYPGMTLAGSVGSQFRVEYSERPTDGNSWQPLTTVTLPSSPYLVIDPTSPQRVKRFYRAVLLSR